MTTQAVVVVPPRGEHRAGLSQRLEEGLVEAFVPEPPDEALGKGVLLRFAGGDVVPFDPALLRPAQDRHAGQFG